jgi:hypothetical protein
MGLKPCQRAKERIIEAIKVAGDIEKQKLALFKALLHHDMREITNSVVHEISSSDNWHDKDTGLQNQNQEIDLNNVLAV